MLAIVLALGSAVGYGGSDFAAGLAARQARVIRVVLLTQAASLAAFTGDLRLPEARGGWLAALAGVIGAPGTILYFFATHRGLLAVAAVLSSLYPAVTIMLARILAGERLTAVRLTGLVLAGASVALIAAGGSVARR